MAHQRIRTLLARFGEQPGVRAGVLGIGLGWCVERLALMASNNVLPLIGATLGATAVTLLPFAVQAGTVLGYLLWLLGAACRRLGSRSAGWVLLALSVLGGVTVLARSAAVLWLGAFGTGVASFGFSLLFAGMAERTNADQRRRVLNNGANTVIAGVYPIVLAGVTWLAVRFGWRLGLGVAACLAPAVCGVALIATVRRRTPPSAIGPVTLRRALRAITEQRRSMRGAGLASALTWGSLAAFGPLVSRAILADGLTLAALALLTLLATPVVLVGLVWERTFSGRRPAAVIAAYIPALVGWAAAALAVLAGERWPSPARLAAWAIAVIAINLAWFTTNALVLRGAALTVGAQPVKPGTLSIRSALQMLPGNLGALAALLAAPLAFSTVGLVPIAIIAMTSLTAAMLAIRHTQRHTPDQPPAATVHETRTSDG